MRESEEKGKEFKKSQPLRKVTPRVLATIKRYTSRENIPPHSFIAQKTNVSKSTISRVINNKLEMQKRRKRMVHVLNLKEKKNRMSNCIKLYKKHLAREKCKFVVTLDESWIRLKFDGHRTNFCCIKREESVPYDWVKEERTLWERKFVVVAAMTYFGTIPLFQVPQKTTMTAHNYINLVLRPLIHKYLIPIFGDDINKVLIHQDKSPVHTAEMTTLYLELMNEKYGIRFITKEDIPVKGADCSPLDFFGFGFLKQKVNAAGCRTLKGLWKKCCTIWSEVSPGTCARVYQSWKKRYRMIHQRLGSHVEQTKEIHRHRARAEK